MQLDAQDCLHSVAVLEHAAGEGQEAYAVRPTDLGNAGSEPLVEGQAENGGRQLSGDIPQVGEGGLCSIAAEGGGAADRRQGRQREAEDRAQHPDPRVHQTVGPTRRDRRSGVGARTAEDDGALLRADEEATAAEVEGRTAELPIQVELPASDGRAAGPQVAVDDQAPIDGEEGQEGRNPGEECGQAVRTRK